MSHWCLAVSLCHSFVLCWRKRRAAASKYEWLESSDLNVHTQAQAQHRNNMAYMRAHTHTHAEDTLCNSVSSAGFVDSICSAPCLPPFAPHPLWQVEGIETHDLRRHTHTHKAHRDPKVTDTWWVFRLHTHTHTHTHTLIYTHLLRGRATVPFGARQTERHVACLHHLLSGQTQDEGLELTAHRRTAAHVQ